MSLASLFITNSSNPEAGYLIISGVNLTRPVGNQANLEQPTPDYIKLIEEFKPDIIDTYKVDTHKNPLVLGIHRVLNVHWAIAFLAFSRRRKYKAIIATGEDVGLPFAFLKKVFRRRTPLTITTHNIAGRRSNFFLKTLGVSSAVQKFQCLSKVQSEMLAERYAIEDSKIQLLYYQVDHHFYKPMPEVKVRQQICSAGRASRDYATLVEACHDLDVDVKIAADSLWFREKLNIDVEQLPERIEARSYGNLVALRHLYAESLFVVVPVLNVAYSAGFTVILEAMAMGKPVIVSRIEQKDDFVIEGYNGLYVTPGDPAELNEKIRYLLDHPEEVARMGQNARKTVEEHYTLEHYLERMKKALAEAQQKQN